MSRIAKTEESPQKPIWESLLERASNKKSELQKLIEEKKQKDDELDPQCTFKPQLIATTYITQNELPFFDRQKQWLESKAQKLNQIRDGTKDKSMEKCSFHPELGPSPTVNDVEIKNTKGMDSFIQRQEKARKLKEEKKQLLNNPYSHLSSEKKALQSVCVASGGNSSYDQSVSHPISKEYESIKKAERIDFSRAVDTSQDQDSEPQQQQQQQKMQLGVAMKMLHNQLYNIKFKSEF